jgi:hypothetical protein
MSVREELKMGQDVTRSPEAEDRCKVAAAVPTVEFESRKAAGHRQAFPGLQFRTGV